MNHLALYIDGTYYAIVSIVDLVDITCYFEIARFDLEYREVHL